MKAPKSGFRFTIIALGALALAGCMADHYMRDEVALRLGHSAWMVDREIAAGPFALKAYERMHERNATANLYIEGDGKAHSNVSSTNMTPENPVALHLATKDKAQNVAWLARPCQYSGMLDGELCKPEDWNGQLYSPEVLRAYSEALDDIKGRWDITGFNVVGFNGGAVIAAELARTRKDILSLRTVAGRLNEIPNPVEIARVPQHHFFGGQDEVTPPAVLHEYLTAAGPSDCIQYTFIQENEHEQGWPDKWPELLKKPVMCETVMVEPMLEFIPPEPIYTTREVPEKP